MGSFLVVGLLFAAISFTNVESESILVVGAAGFIGYHVMAALVSDGNIRRDVIGIDNYSPSATYKRQRSWDLLRKFNAHITEIDACDVVKFDKLLDRFSFTHVLDLTHRRYDSLSRNRVCSHQIYNSLSRYTLSNSHSKILLVYISFLNSPFYENSANAPKSGVTVLNIQVDANIYGPWDRPNSSMHVTLNMLKNMSSMSRSEIEPLPPASGERNPAPQRLIHVSGIIDTVLKVINSKDVMTNLTISVESVESISDVIDLLHKKKLYRSSPFIQERHTHSVSSTKMLLKSRLYETLSWYTNYTHVKLPCASECSSSRDCFPSRYDDAIVASNRLSSNCDVVFYTVGLHQFQSSLKKVNSPKISSSCCIAFILFGSPLSDREKDAYNGWNLIRVHATTGFESARKASRVPKLNPARFFARRVRYAVYFDSSSTPTLNPEDVPEYMTSPDNAKRASVLMFHHPTIMYYGESSVRSAMSEADLAKIRSGMPDRLEEQKHAYEQASLKNDYFDELRYTAMPTALFIIWDLHSMSSHEFRCRWYDEYILWGDRDQVSLFYILAGYASRLNYKSAAFQEWLQISSMTSKIPSYLRLLLGKKEIYSPFFTKGEDSEKGYPKNSMNSG
jgi:nucleoside-diphosphate-sugar epimerase